MENSINGINVQIIRYGDGYKRIERIISTDPNDFLNANCQPGVFINLPNNIEGKRFD